MFKCSDALQHFLNEKFSQIGIRDHLTVTL